MLHCYSYICFKCKLSIFKTNLQSTISKNMHSKTVLIIQQIVKHRFQSNTCSKLNSGMLRDILEGRLLEEDKGKKMDTDDRWPDRK